MNELKKFLKDMIMNPGGTDYSTKRTIAWILLFTTITIGFIGLLKDNINETIFITVFTGFLSSVVGTLGITSFDYTQFLKHDKKGFKGESADNPL